MFEEEMRKTLILLQPINSPHLGSSVGHTHRPHTSVGGWAPGVVHRQFTGAWGPRAPHHSYLLRCSRDSTRSSVSMKIAVSNPGIYYLIL